MAQNSKYNEVFPMMVRLSFWNKTVLELRKVTSIRLVDGPLHIQYEICNDGKTVEIDYTEVRSFEVEPVDMMVSAKPAREEVVDA